MCSAKAKITDRKCFTSRDLRFRGVEDGPEVVLDEAVAVRAENAANRKTQQAAPLLLDANEAAALLAISSRTLWKFASAGCVPEPVRLGRTVRWRAAELRAWVDMPDARRRMSGGRCGNPSARLTGCRGGSAGYVDVESEAHREMRSSKPQHQPKPIHPLPSYLVGCGKLLLDAKDMADFLRIPRKRVQGLIDCGRLPRMIRVGGCVRWSVSELRAWLAVGCPRIEEWSRIQGRREGPLRDWRYHRVW